jgi:hypothetical protein
MRPSVCLAIGVCILTALAGAQPARVGLNKVIAPGRTTFDTLGFYPPADGPGPSGPAMARVVKEVTATVDSIDFPMDEALEIYLIHAGIVDTLVHGLMKSGADFTRTVFNDTAVSSIGQGTPPFTGTFAPARPLSQFAGTDASGLWILEIINHSADRMGVLEEWGVGIGFSLVFTSIGGTSGDLPGTFQLFQNYPNPFNPSTTIRYGIPGRSHVTLTVFNALGERLATLADGDEEAGYHQVRLDGGTLASGVYFYTLRAGAYTETRRLLLLR